MLSNISPYNIFLILLVGLFMLVLGWARNQNTQAQTETELIVLAAPTLETSYYDPVADDIFDFHIAYAEQIIANGDRVVILTDETFYADYADVLGAEYVIVAPMLDIWMRDFTLSNAVSPVMFRYTPEGQGGDQAISDEVQDVFAYLIEEAGLQFAESDLLNDGGNFVDDYAGSVILTTKFLTDNNLTEDQARSQLQALDGIEHVAFIEADPTDTLGHSDGAVSFVDTNTVLINSFPDDPDYMAQIRADLERGLPDVVIHEVITPYDETTIYDDYYGSACGLYTNALVTPNRIYFPQFGIPEDEVALEQVRAATTREVIPVSSEQVCHMGGGVRCMSWQLRGDNAERFLANLVNG